MTEDMERVRVGVAVWGSYALGLALSDNEEKPLALELWGCEELTPNWD